MEETNIVVVMKHLLRNQLQKGASGGESYPSPLTPQQGLNHIVSLLISTVIFIKVGYLH